MIIVLPDTIQTFSSIPSIRGSTTLGGQHLGANKNNNSFKFEIEKRQQEPPSSIDLKLIVQVLIVYRFNYLHVLTV